RSSAAFGIDITALPSGVLSDHVFPRPASPIFPRFVFACVAPASCVARISVVEFASGEPAPVIVNESSSAQLEMYPGMLATCIASLPSDIDFSCGFQASLSLGTRSSTRRVVASSCSSSAIIAWVADIFFLLLRCALRYREIENSPYRRRRRAALRRLVLAARRRELLGPRRSNLRRNLARDGPHGRLARSVLQRAA